ncbi:4094_t:CDS:1, partial [Acaulospora colombiana]
MSDNNSHLYKIELLDSTNWLAWKKKTEAVLRRRKLIQYIDGTRTRPVPAKVNEPDETEKGLIEAWEEKDQEAQDQILLTLGQDEMVHVDRATTAKEMWDALIMVKETGGKGTIIDDLRELFRTTADDDTNIDEHLTDIRRLQSQLRRQNADIPDWIYTAIMLTSLPISWDAFATAYIGRSAGGAFDVNSTQMESLVRNEWRRRNKDKTGGQVMLAGGSQGNRKGIRNRSNVQCFNCKRTGHTKEQCWRAGGGAAGQGPKQKNRQQGKEQAHQAAEDSSDSPFDMVFNIFSHSEEDSVETAATAGAGRKSPFTRKDWVMDSGTTSHIATEREMFREYKEHKEELKVPGGKK